MVQLDVELVVTLGALLADSPHTRPVPVSGTASDPAVARAMGLERSRYEGPTGIVGVFQDFCAKAGVPAVSFWAAVPHYVATPPCPKATVALLRRVEDLLDLSVPLEDLPERARAWERQVDELTSDDQEVREYITSLEEREPETDLPEASGEAIAKEFERYLRRRGDGRDDHQQIDVQHPLVPQRPERAPRRRQPAGQIDEDQPRRHQRAQPPAAQPQPR